MNLQETVSKMLNKEVSNDTAKQVADSQFGTLMTFVIENKPKKYSYILVSDEETTQYVGGGNYDLEDILFEIGKYDTSKLDFSLLGKIETYGSYLIITEEEYNILSEI